MVTRADHRPIDFRQVKIASLEQPEHDLRLPSDNRQMILDWRTMFFTASMNYISEPTFRLRKVCWIPPNSKAASSISAGRRGSPSRRAARTSVACLSFGHIEGATELLSEASAMRSERDKDRP